jgi:hypothetical protein
MHALFLLEGAEMASTPDFAAAAEFLAQLDPNTQDFCFRTFDDIKKWANPNLKGKFNGTLDEHFSVLGVKSSLGAGVFVVINEGGQNAEEITRVRYTFVDTDGAPPEPIVKALPPHMVIQSSPGKYHVYWRSAGVPLEQFSSIQKAAIAKFGTDKAVHDLPRVMRLPGFDHQKEAPTRVAILDATPSLPDYTVADFLVAFGVPAKAASVPKPLVIPPGGSLSLNAILAGRASSTSETFNLQEVEAMLRHIEPFQDRMKWLRVGGAIADEFGEAGRDLFHRWSRGDLWEGKK